MIRLRRRKPEPSARQQIDVWLQWMELDGRSTTTELPTRKVVT